MSNLRIIFDDTLTRLAAIVFVVIVALLIFNTVSNVAEWNPLLGIFTYGLVPVLVIIGGIIFLLAVFRSRSTNDE